MDTLDVKIQFPPAAECLEMIRKASKQSTMSNTDAFILEAWVTRLMKKAGMIDDEGKVIEGFSEPPGEGEPLEGEVVN